MVKFLVPSPPPCSVSPEAWLIFHDSTRGVPAGACEGATENCAIDAGDGLCPFTVNCLVVSPPELVACSV